MSKDDEAALERVVEALADRVAERLRRRAMGGREASVRAALTHLMLHLKDTAAAIEGMGDHIDFLHGEL